MQSYEDAFKAICLHSKEDKTVILGQVAIIEAAKKGGGKEAVREKMMSEYTKLEEPLIVQFFEILSHLSLQVSFKTVMLFTFSS